MRTQRLVRRSWGTHIGLLLVLWLSMLAGPQAQPATLPAGFSATLVASGLASPTAMQFAPDGRLFVAEQGGRLRVIKDGALLPTPFLTVTVSSVGERGLLGVAFDPAFSTNHYVYVYYTATSPAIHNRISRFTANGDVAVAGSELILLELDNLSSATNHNGGALAFGSDGKLYAAVGENANGANAQSFTNLHGKMLRLNTDGTIPADNPFLGTTSGKNRAIYALGLRNPFTFAFHPSTRPDVHQRRRPEHLGGDQRRPARAPTMDGQTPKARPQTRGSSRRYTPTAAAQARHARSPAGRSTRQRPSSFRLSTKTTTSLPTTAPGGLGGSTRLRVATRTHSLRASPLQSISKWAVTGACTIWPADRVGVVYRISYTASAPSITTHPSSQTVAPGASVTFSVRASGLPPLQYQWQRNGVNISGATAQDYTTVAAAGDNGARFRAIVSNANGNVMSNEAVLTVTSNQPPTGTITQPVAGTLYSGAQRHQLRRNRDGSRERNAWSELPSPGESISITTRTRTRSSPR